MEPQVLYLLLCDEVRTDPQNYLRVDVLGLMTLLRSTAEPPFPVVRPRFTVLVVLTGGQGAGEIALRIVQADTGRLIFQNQPRRVQFVGTASESISLAFRVLNCAFPDEGVYWVECVFSGSVVARQRLLLIEERPNIP